MMNRSILITALFMFLFAAAGSGEELRPVKLPPAQTTGGKPLMQALAERKSTREFSAKELPPQVLSDLLWAANGVNRSNGRRTAPSAHDAREIDIYVAKKEGLYLYDAAAHVLTPVLPGDIRPLTGKQSFPAEAPVDLVFVADLKKLGHSDAEFYGATDTGFVSQNVYLYCASEGLATVVLGWVDKDKLAAAMKLRPDQRIILTQPVGYPEE